MCQFTMFYDKENVVNFYQNYDTMDPNLKLAIGTMYKCIYYYSIKNCDLNCRWYVGGIHFINWNKPITIGCVDNGRNPYYAYVFCTDNIFCTPNGHGTWSKALDLH